MPLTWKNRACRESSPASPKGTFQIQNTARRRPEITVSANGTGIVSHAGGVLLTQALPATGLDARLTAALGRWKAPRAVQVPGKSSPTLP